MVYFALMSWFSVLGAEFPSLTLKFGLVRAWEGLGQAHKELRRLRAISARALGLSGERRYSIEKLTP